MQFVDVWHNLWRSKVSPKAGGLKLSHSIEPELARKVLGRLNEVRDALNQEIGHISSQIQANSDVSILKGLVDSREALLQKRKKLLLSNLLRVAVEDLVEKAYAPAELLNRMDATGEPRHPETNAVS